MITTFKFGTDEYKKLKMAAEILSFMDDREYWVADCYFDFGQDWMWTTILKSTEIFDSCQALYPAQHERILNAEGIDELVEVCKDILKKV